MAEFEVVWTESAERDLNELTWWWVQESPDDARGVLRRILERAGSLETFPRRGRRVPELMDLGIEAVRELVISPYRLIYEVVPTGRVVVIALFDGRRDLESVLLDRLLSSGR